MSPVRPIGDVQSARWGHTRPTRLRRNLATTRCVRFLVVWTALLLVSGCSTFNRDWKAVTTSPSGLASGWDGEWRRDSSRHRGRLRAIVVPLSPEQHHVRFRASFGRILRYGYSMDLAIQPGVQGTNTFNGSADLGIWGIYRCEGTLSSNAMEARYDAARSHGVFRLNRVDPPPAQP